MATTETDPASYLCAVRKVVLPNPQVEAFRDQLVIDARETLGEAGYNTVTLPASLDAQLKPGYVAKYENVAQLRADVFSVRSLRVVLFMRRAAASEEVNRLLTSAYVRLTNPEFFTGRTRRTRTGRREPVPVRNDLQAQLRDVQIAKGSNPGNLAVVSSNIVRTAIESAPEQRYALQIDGPSRSADVLQAQQDVITDASRRIQSLKGLMNDHRFDTMADPLTLTCVRVPGGRNREIERFEEAINLHAPLQLELGPVEWRLKCSATSED